MTSQLRSTVTELVGRHPGSAGDDYFLALSFARTPGIPLALANPKDPRTLWLAPDALFLWSLQGSPVLQGFRGTLDASGYLRAKIVWPKLPGTGGTVIQCGGWISRRGTGTITELLPTVEVVLP